MYAIVEIAGQQFKVEEGKKIFVHRLKAEDGQSIEFDQVLLIEDKGKVTVGEPVISDAVIEAKVLEHLKGDKVIVFKKKRRKGYRVKNGHRQYFTKVEIVSIKEKATRKRAAARASEEVKNEEVIQTAEVKPAAKTRTAKAKSESPAEKPELKAAPRKRTKENKE